MNELVGKKVRVVSLSDDATVLVFYADEGTVSYSTYAECCSESWINHVSGIDNLVGHRVRSVSAPEWEEVVQLEYGDEGFSGRQEVDSAYSLQVFTDRGVCEFELRNASNGYYGGSLDLVDVVPDGHEFNLVLEDI